MYQAVWKGVVIAESDRTIVVEGKRYFPAESVDHECLEPSARRTVCPRKGAASYYHVWVDGEPNRDAAWYYPSPRPAAVHIAGYVAFWRGVRVREVADGRSMAKRGQGSRAARLPEPGGDAA
jgi:uncharacterized protein (DUF427 family)